MTAMTAIDTSVTRRPVRLIGLASAAAAGALLLSACGSQEPTVGEAWSQARTQLQEAESFRLSVDQSSGSGSDEATGEVHISGFTTEPNAELTMEMADDDTGMSVAMREVGEKGYVKMNVDSTEMDEEDKALLGFSDKWREQEIPEDERGMMKSLRDHMLEDLPAADALEDSEAERQEVDHDGVKAYRYEVPAEVAEAAADSEDEEQEADQDSADAPGTAADSALSEVDLSQLQAFLVDDDGHLVALELKGLNPDEEDQVRELRFSDWDAVEKVEAPAEDEIQTGQSLPGTQD